MDNLRAAPTAIEADGLSVVIDGEYLAASLRYFDAQGSFVAMLRHALGVALPEALRAVRVEVPPRTEAAPIDGERFSRGEATTGGEAPPNDGEGSTRGEATSRRETATRGEAPRLGEGPSLGERPVNSSSQILVWRSPTEMLLLSKDPPAFAQLEAELAAAADGCMVNQTGGLRVLRIQGRRTDYLLTRLGAMSAIPAIGEARTGRFAEVQATAVRLAADEVLLIVERVYADHLLEWIEVTAGDF